MSRGNSRHQEMGVLQAPAPVPPDGEHLPPRAKLGRWPAALRSRAAAERSGWRAGHAGHERAAVAAISTVQLVALKAKINQGFRCAFGERAAHTHWRLHESALAC